MNYKYIVGTLIILLTSSCAVVNTHPNVKVGPIQEIDLTIAKDTIIDLNITAGEVVIESSPGEQLRAEMTVECPGINSECAKRMAGLEFVSSIKDKHLKMSTNRNSFFQNYNANLSVKFFVPKSQQLNIGMDAGTLYINNIDACLNVEMSAGDIDINMFESNMASVYLDTAFGDVSLNVDGRHQNESRPWLVGGEIIWDQGKGSCQMKVDLQAGTISVDLGG